MPPPTRAMTQDSSSTSARIRPSLKPSVFSTPSSFVRSRIDCAMALPATNRMKNMTMAAIAIMMAPMSPICLAKSDTNAFSVAVLVSAGEFANIPSMRLRELIGRRRVGDPEDVPADLTVEVARSCGTSRSRYVPVEEELRLVGALDRRIVDAVDREFPGRAVRLPVDRRDQRNAIADLPFELLRQCRSRRSRRCGWPTRPSSDPRAARTPGYIRSQLSGSTAMFAKKLFGSW